MKMFNKLFLLTLIIMSIVSCSKESTAVAPNEEANVDPKLEGFSATEIDNMSGTDLLEIELNTTLEERVVTLTDESGNDLELLIASENLNSIAAYLTSRKLGLNGTIQNINLVDYDLPSENLVKDAPVYVEFLTMEAAMTDTEMVLSVETVETDAAQLRYDEEDVFTSSANIEGFNFTNQFFGPPAAVTRMKVTHESRRTRFSRFSTVSQQTVESGNSASGCRDGRRTRVTIEHNSGPNDLYFFAFDNCA